MVHKEHAGYKINIAPPIDCKICTILPVGYFIYATSWATSFLLFNIYYIYIICKKFE